MKKLREVFAVIILLGCFTALFFWNNSSSKDENENYLSTTLPASTIYYIRFDAIQFLKELSTIALFDIQDQEFFTNLKAQIDESKQDSSSFMENGIDNFSPIDVLVCDIDNAPVILIRFKLLDEESFIRFGNQFKKQTIINGNFGYMSLSPVSKSNIEVAISNQLPFQIEIKGSAEVVICEMENGKHIASYEIDHQEKEINLKVRQISSKISTFYIPEENGVEFCWKPNSIEKKWLNSINSSLDSIFSSINYISGTYSGFKFLDNTNLFGIPKASLFISFKNPIDKKTTLEKISTILNLSEFNTESNSIQLTDDVSLYCHQISPNEVLFNFSSQTPTLKKQKLSSKFIGGNLSAILKFENSGYYQYLIDAIPGIIETYKLLNETQTVRFQNTNEQEGKLTLKFNNSTGFYSTLIQIISRFL